MKFFLIALLFSSAALAQNRGDMHILYASGSAEKAIEPNMLIVQLESWAKSSTAEAAQNQQSIQFNKIKNAVEKFKIRKEDIQTLSYSVNPEYVYDSNLRQNRMTGYRVTHSIAIIERRTEDAGAFLDAMVSSKNEVAGVNVESISWDYDKKDELQNSILAEAVKNARAKANEMAKAAGVEIRAVHKIQQTGYNPPIARPMVAEAMVKNAGMTAAPSTELSSGQVKVKADVDMEFEIQ